MEKLIYRELSHQVLGACFSVHNIMGPGLLESAYEQALVIELGLLHCTVARQVIYPLHYKGQLAGAYIADLVVEGKVLLELKAVKAFTPVMEAQIINYLRLSGIPVGYLVNFRNSRVEWSRFVVQGE